MPLDFDLITNSTNHSLVQLSNIIKTDCPHLYLLENFLNPALLDKLIEFVNDDSNVKWNTVLYQEKTVRRSISWIPDTVIEEVHTVMENLTGAMENLFRKNTRFIGISIWKDIHPYSISMHIDNNTVSTAIQIYLTSGPANMNTVFKYNNTEIGAVYQKNSGYIMDNTYKVSHGMLTPVPENHSRYSLYAIWADE